MPDQTITITAVLKDQFTRPGSQVRGVIQGLTGDAGKLAASVSPLAGQLKAFIAGFVGIAAARRSLSEAKFAEDSEQRLKSALADNKRLVEDIKILAQDIQKTTRVSDDQVVKLAASLAERDVPLNKLQDTIRAASQVSAALGMDIESAGAQMAITFQGIIPRSVSRAIPELKRLSKEELALGGAVDKVNEIFKGRAEAFANTPFGKIEQAENRIGDTFEKVGGILARAESKLLDAVSTQFEKLVNFLAGPAGQVALNKLVDLAILILKNLDAIVLLVATYKGVQLLTNVFIRLAAAMSFFANLERTIVRGGTAISALAVSTKQLALGVTIAAALGVALGVVFNNLTNIGPKIKNLDDLRKAFGDFVDRSSEGRLGTGEVLEGIAGTLSGAARGIGVDIDIEGGRQEQVNDRIREEQRLSKSRTQILAGEAEKQKEIQKATASFVIGIDQSIEDIRKTASERSAEEDKKFQLDAADFLLKSRVAKLLAYTTRKQEIERKDLEETVEKAEEAADAAQKAFSRAALDVQEFPTITNKANLERTGELLQAAEKTAAEQRRKLQDVLIVQQRDFALASVAAEKQAREDLNEVIARTNNLEESGLISTQEKFRRNAESVREYRDSIDEAIKKLEELKAASDDQDFIHGIDRLVVELKRRQDEAVENAKTLRETIRENLQEPTEDFIKSIIRGTKSLKEAFADFLGNIADQLAAFAARGFATQALNFLFGTPAQTPASQATTGILGGLIGGLGHLFGFLEGGIVPGPRGAGDVMTVRASPGEGFIKRRAVDHYGPSLIQAINEMAVPRGLLAGFGRAPRLGGVRFAEGGFVGSDSGGGTVVGAVIAPTEENANNLVRKANRALFDFIQANPGLIRRAANS